MSQINVDMIARGGGNHDSSARYGIPIAFLSTGGHRDYHQVTDEPAYLVHVRFARVTRFRIPRRPAIGR